MRVSFHLVNRVIHLSAQRGLDRREVKEYHAIGIDEKSFRKGHNYITVLSDSDTGNVINVGEGRTKEASISLIKESLNKEQRSHIKTVSMDMSKAYIGAVKEVLPDSKICFDKFHLVQYLNNAVDQVRRREVKKQEELINTRYIWLKDHTKLTDKQRAIFQSIDLANYKTARAWRIKENFRDIHFKQSSTEAYILLNQWIRDAKKCGLGAIIKVANMIERHTQGIINAMCESKSNAMAERINGKIQEVKSIARGYHSFEKFKNAILFFHGGLSLYPQQTQ